MIFDYETIKLVWWLLIGILLIGFAITDGMDMGVGIMLPFVGKNDIERRVVINTVGPHWDGNQVWLVTAGGALFAAWPAVYGAAFSGFYFAMLLALFALFFRPVGLDYRSKIEDPRWRSTWDWGLFIGGVVPPLIFGIAFGNLIQGVPFYLDEFLRAHYTGSFLGLLNPFALLAGVISLSMVTLHGAIWLQLRTEDEIAERSKVWVKKAAIVTMASFALAGLWVIFGLDGYQIVSQPALDALPNPLAKTVEIGNGNLSFRIEENTKFCVKTTIEADDEWLHSFYYFNDEIPSEEDFEKTVGDYLTFEFSMIMQNREYLFKDEDETE
jgi:cytochrome d ubiquinol oxidase subunit II